MNLKILSIIIAMLYWATDSMAQRDDIVLSKDKKEFAFNSIKELKEGALVVRLKTNHRKIKQLENTLKSSKLKKNQRKRYQAMLDGTIKTRDDFNNAISDMFMDSFSFCSVYLMYDSCSRALKNGVRSGIFLGPDKTASPSIQLKEKHVFIINYKKSSSDFPVDVLRMQKLHERLEDPFPYYLQLRESWVNQINSPRAAQAVIQLDRKLRNFYSRALEYDIKKAERLAKKEARKAEKEAEKQNK